MWRRSIMWLEDLLLGDELIIFFFKETSSWGEMFFKVPIPSLKRILVVIMCTWFIFSGLSDLNSLGLWNSMLQEKKNKTSSQRSEPILAHAICLQLWRTDSGNIVSSSMLLWLQLVLPPFVSMSGIAFVSMPAVMLGTPHGYFAKISSCLPTRLWVLWVYFMNFYILSAQLKVWCYMLT